MDDNTIESLLQHLKENTKKSFVVRTDEDGVARRNAANLGATVGQQTRITRGGDYEGLTVEILSPLRPLVTDETMRRVLLALRKEAVTTALELLSLSSVEEMFYVIDLWFTAGTMNYKSTLEYTYETEEDYAWVTRDIHSPLAASVRLVSLVPTLPEEWAGRVFSSGDELQKAWSAVRQGPPVTYAVIYTMMIVEEEPIVSAEDVDASRLYLIDGDTYRTATEAELGYDYVVYDDVAIGFRALFAHQSGEKVEEVNGTSVSRLVSQLQKCVRYGPLAASLLVETVAELSVSSDYHVPERNFERVSAARQLAWRSYISILEDVGPLRGSTYLLLLTLVASKVRGHFSSVVLEHITSLLLQSLAVNKIEDRVNWRKKSIAKTGAGDYDLALRFIPMMEGDTRMLLAYSSMWNEVLERPTQDIDLDVPIPENVVVRSIDHHCMPSTIILLQACGGSELTLEQTSRLIWTSSSSYNYRLDSKVPGDDTDLYGLQSWIASGSEHRRTRPIAKFEEEEGLLTAQEARVAFMSLFGQTYAADKKHKRCCYAGSVEAPLKIMTGKEWKDSEALPMPPTRVKTKDLPLPLGYRWRKSAYEVEVTKKGVPLVDGVVLPYYDASSLVMKASFVPEGASEEFDLSLLTALFNLDPIPWEIYLYLLTNTSTGVEWSHIEGDKELISLILVKLEESSSSSLIQIGPVDRSGVGTKGAVHKTLEGKVWGAMVLFSYLYPSAVMMKGHLTFAIERDAAFAHMVSSLRVVLDRAMPVALTSSAPIVIVTELWKHQKESRDRIVGAFRAGVRGLGNASDVGSGKTLTTLAVIAELHAEGGGKTLIQVPTPALLPTWTDEIVKHTKGFRSVMQESNGTWVSLTGGGTYEESDIYLSTMARTRDHPPSQRWKLMVIDECLSVQNNKAQWTAAAWKQSIFSQHILMLSATFFRSRYDKLYFMLKMLRSNIPETKNYLDAILIETMLSEQPANGRIWTTEHVGIDVPDSFLSQQRAIINSNMTVENKYSKIASLLTHMDVVPALRKITQQKGRRCLIYARSASEAESWSESLSIPIYPDISQRHVIITLSRGTYGLNDLVSYNTIVCRPPEPDRLPQMKGRLDRPGQRATELALVYFYFAGTIEEGGLRRLEVARQFDKHYKMPLSKYYEVSLAVTRD